MDQKENVIDQDLTLQVILPGGLEKTAIVHSSKPMMDLLVMLCAKYHLNPSSHTIELITTNRNHVKFKPNTLIGILDVEKVVIKPKGVDDKNKKSFPQVPEATVRLIINYKKTQKTILRVNPHVPLAELLPAVCEKCEFDQKTTVLLRDARSEDPLDLTRSLNDFGLREVYARDTKGNTPAGLPLTPNIPEEKNPQSKETKGLFSVFRRSKKKPDQAHTSSAPSSPVLGKQNLEGNTGPTYSSSTLPCDVPKKRRAPLPPMMLSQSLPTSLGEQQSYSHHTGQSGDNQKSAALAQGDSSESSLKRTKRKAPPPPCAAAPDETHHNGSVAAHGTAAVVPPAALEEVNEQEETPCLSGCDSSAMSDDSSLNLSADASEDSGRTEPFSDPANIEMHGVGGDQKDLSSDVTDEQKSEAVQAVDDGLHHEELHHDMGHLSAPQPLPEHSPTFSTSQSPVPSPTFSVPQSPISISPSLQSSDGTSLTPQSSVSPCPVTLSLSSQSLSAVSLDCAPMSPIGLSPHSTSLHKVLLDTSLPCFIPQLITQEVGVQAFAAPAGDGGTEPEISCNGGKEPCIISTLHQLPGVSSSILPETETPALKKDMATSTEELSFVEAVSASSQVSEEVNVWRGAMVAPPVYIQESEPKPKPSNEITREYTPKVGLTTYTIVPQKSLEKLKLFEVELTLEAPSDPCDTHVHNEEAVDSCTKRSGSCWVDDEEEVIKIQGQSDDTNAMKDVEHTVASPGRPALSDAFDGVTQACAERDKKTPPAIKPKPASFRLPQQTRTPGDYVTSAAARSVTTVACQRKTEEQSREGLSSVPCTDEFSTTSDQGISGQEVQEMLKICSEPALPSSPEPSKPIGLSLEKLRSFAAPKPYTPTTPSRFALAVSYKVRKSQFSSPGSVLMSPAQRLQGGWTPSRLYSSKDPSRYMVSDASSDGSSSDLTGME